MGVDVRVAVIACEPEDASVGLAPELYCCGGEENAKCETREGVFCETLEEVDGAESGHNDESVVKTE